MNKNVLDFYFNAINLKNVVISDFEKNDYWKKVLVARKSII